MACAVCGHPLAPLFTKDGHHFGRCTTCRHAQLDPLPSEDEARRLYGHGYFAGEVTGGYDDYDADEALHRRNARARLRRLDRAAGGVRGRVLDIGCASGYFLDEARRDGWAVHGVDVSPAARARAAGLGIEVTDDLAEVAAADPAGFDAVTLFQVLEHAVDPVATLGLAADCLRPGGTVLIETWDRGSAVARVLRGSWQQVAPPSVLHLFGRQSLHESLLRAGFHPGRPRPSSKWVSAGFVASLATAGRTSLGRGRLGRLPLLYAFGDLVTVSGRLL